MAARVTASIVTIGNELLSGDTVNTNAAWLAQQLEELGVVVTLMASLPDEIDRVAEFVRTESDRADIVLVTGGLGGTPDDITREAIAAAFEAPQDEVSDLAANLRSRFPSDPEYAARWANLPAGARPLENPLGGAPGFVVGNVYVMPGLPAEMKAMFATVTGELRDGAPDHLVAPNVRDDGGEDRRRARRRWAIATRACSSARTRSSMRTARRSRSSSSPQTRPRSRRPSRGSSRRSSRRRALLLDDLSSGA